MGYIVPNNLSIWAPKPADDRTGVWDGDHFRPFIDTAEAFLLVDETRRAEGLIIRVGTGSGKAHAFVHGTTDQGWDLKPDGGGLTAVPDFGSLPVPGDEGIIYVTEDTGRSYYWDGTGYVPFADPKATFQAYPDRASFPATGEHGVLYMAEDNGALYFWNGTTYVSSGGGLKVYDTFALLPIPGQDGFIYYTKLEKILYYWDGTQYRPLVDPAGFIQNQFASAQTADFWISGTGKIDRGLTVSVPMGVRPAIKGSTNYNGVGGDFPNLELDNPQVGGRVWLAMIGPAAGAGSAYIQLVSGGSFGKYLNRLFFSSDKGFGFLAGDGSGTPADITFASGTMNDPYTMALIGATRNVIIGGGTDNGARLQIVGGILSLANNSIDFAVLDGGIFYRNDVHKFRVGVNGVWKFLLTEDAAAAGFIQNQFAVDQTANFRINGQGQITAIGVPALILKAGSAGNGSFIEFQTQTKVQGYIIFSPADGGPSFNLRHAGSSLNWVFAEGLATTNPAPGNGHTGFDLGGWWMGQTTPTSGYAAGPKAFFMYDNAVNKYHLVIKPNGHWVIGGVNPAQDNGAAVQITDGPISLANNTGDFPIVNGALFYRSDTHTFRGGVNGFWRNILAENQVGITGGTIYVDVQCPSATDTRTGISSFSRQMPFKTIQAGLMEGRNYGQAAIKVCICTGTYNENISATELFFNIELEQGVVINGTVFITGGVNIVGTGSDSPFVNQAIIQANSASPTLEIQHRHGYEYNVLKGLKVINTGTGHAFSGIRHTFATDCIFSAATGLGFTTVSATMRNCHTKSGGNHAALVTLEAYDSTFITTSTGGHDAIGNNNTAGIFLERCKLYSETGHGVVASNWDLNTIVRNSLFNTFLEALYVSGNNTGAGPLTEVVGNIMNVRDPATVNAFITQYNSNPSAVPAVVMNNRYNKASFYAYSSGLASVVADNIAELPFHAKYPFTNY